MTDDTETPISRVDRETASTPENAPEDYVLTAVLGILDVVLKPVVARIVADARPEQAMHLFRMLTPRQLGTVIALMEHYVAKNNEVITHGLATRARERPSRPKRRKQP